MDTEQHVCAKCGIELTFPYWIDDGQVVCQDCVIIVPNRPKIRVVDGSKSPYREWMEEVLESTWEEDA